jgi:hypothetical protein
MPRYLNVSESRSARTVLVEALHETRASEATLKIAAEVLKDDEEAETAATSSEAATTT